MSGSKLAIIGGGLVGSALASFLAKRGYSIDVFEKRGDMRREKVGEGRSINLAISARGLYALDQLELKDECLPHVIPMPGRMIHPLEGKVNFQPYGRDNQCIYSVSRNGLNQILMTAAEKTGRVRYHFHHEGTGIDREGKTLEIKHERGTSRFSYDRIIGTDGSASIIRECLKHQGCLDATETTLAHGYKEIVMPRLGGSGFAIEKNALHIWPRGSDMLIALPNEDGSFTCTLFLPFEGERSFAKLDNPVRVENFFSGQFRDAVPHLPNLCDEFFSNPTGKMVTVKCAPWFVGGRILLLGDAAHAIVPFFGQGMNCGFEDCTALDECLDKWNDDWEAALDDFFSRRKANADAIADMAVENFIEMRDRVNDPKFILEKKVERILQAAFPQRYIPRYTLVSFTRVPYRHAYDMGIIHQKILGELCAGLEIPEDVDIARAKTLIEAQLPLTAPQQ